MLAGIPPARKGKESVQVTFSYDMNGILQVKAKSVSTGKEVSADISTTGIEAFPVLDITKWESAPGAKRYRPILRKAEKLMAGDTEYDTDLEVLVRQIKEALLLGRGEQAESLREELLDLLEFAGMGR
jgi:molecular chaperone DnaK